MLAWAHDDNTTDLSEASQGHDSLGLFTLTPLLGGGVLLKKVSPVMSF